MRPCTPSEEKVFLRALPPGEGAVSFDDFMLHGMNISTPPASRAQTASGDQAAAPVVDSPSGELIMDESKPVGTPLGDEHRARAESLHAAFDRLGDNNGTVEKEEIAAVDKKGKLFAKLDASSTGHVAV